MSTDSSKVEFIQNHVPAMESGVYRIHVEQAVSGGTIPGTSTSTADAAFAVTGERYSYLAPKDVFGVFPPVGHTGDFQNVLPHVTVNRSTLPWERMPDGATRGVPWLALLLLRDSDFAGIAYSQRPRPQVITVQDLNTPSSVIFPQPKAEPAQDPNDKVTVIDLPRSVLAPILPRKSDLAFLAHVRQPKDGDGNALGDELATVFCNRLPQNGGTSTAYLVSVEDRYSNGDEFDAPGTGDGDLIRLVCLQSFTFACPDETESFTEILLKLDHNPSTLSLPPTGKDTNADSRLAAGYVPMPHKLREGDQTVSWYRGPLVPGSLSATDEAADVLNLPIQAADAILRYDSSTSMFDVSYAAAWELGRVLTLQNKGVSTALYNWKRSTAQSLWQDEQAVEHLPLQGKNTNPSVPDAVATWFQRLSLLQGIPFNYLVPDERMLPVESIRFFTIDPHWIESLLDGAFSIGRVTSKDMNQDKPSTTPYANLSGFLLRSCVVSGWPGLLVDGYDQVITDGNIVPDQPPLTLLRMDRLSPNVLLCLFSGDVKTVDIHLAPETMHFGVDDFTGGAISKTPRSGTNNQPIPVPWLNESAQVIDIAKLASLIQEQAGASTYTSAQFALDMIEGVPKVRFLNQGR